MIDFTKIPEPVYLELVDVFGIDKAYNIIDDCEYNIICLNNKLARELIIRFFRLRKLRDWVKRILKFATRYILKAAKYIAKNRMIFLPLIITSIIASIIYLLIIL